jgi:ribonuclease D
LNEPHIYVDTESSLESLVKRVGRSSRIAVDMEADSFHHYFEKVCLIQVAAAGKVYLVDPLAGLDLSEFLDVLADKKLIFHDGGYDLRMMLSSFGFSPKVPIFDTMIAAQLLGYEKFSLSALPLVFL